jgi:hypothetical protein
VNLMSASAGESMRQELENMYTTQYILSQKEVAEIALLSGYPVRALNKKPRPSCHWQIAVMRDMLRKSYISEVRPETTRLKTLVVASAYREIAKYWKNPNVDFYVYGREAKDGKRVLMQILEDLRAEVANRAILTEDVAGVAVPKGKRRAVLTIRDLENMLLAYQAVKDGDEPTGARIFLKVPDKKYDQLLVEDGHYNFRREDWLDLFQRTGAMNAWVIGMMPYELLFEGAPESRVYSMREQKKPAPFSWVEVAKAAFLAMELSSIGRDGQRWLATVLAAGLFYLAEGIKRRSYDIFVRDALLYFSKFEKIAAAFGVRKWQTRILAAIQLVWERWSARLGTTELVMTYHGHSNGYIHDRDAMMTLLEQPWLGSAKYSFALHTEIYQRLGPMVMARVYPAALEERVARSLCLGRNEKFVMVLDLFDSYDFLNNAQRPKKYIPVYYYEYFDVIDFLATQKPETISVPMAMTMVRRASAGLSLGKTQLAPAWRLDNEYLYRVAANACLVALSRIEEAERISQPVFKKLVTEESSRWERFLARAMVVGACVATAGLVIPVFTIYSWLAEKSVKYPLYEIGEDSVYQEDGNPAWAEYAREHGVAQRGGGYELEFPLREKASDRPRIEDTCDFIHALGDVGKQDPICMHKRGQGAKKVNLSMSAEEVARLRSSLVEGRDSAPNSGIEKTIDDLIDVLDKDRNGYHYSAEVEVVRGPPGVGKSYTMRGLMAVLHASGKAVAVHSPFGKLSSDYTVATEQGGPFPFYTTHKLYRVGKLHCMVVEEYTNMDERLIAYMAYRTGAQSIIMIGDEKQTGLMPTEGERPFKADGILKIQEAREHVLPICFRSDMYTVALLNVECGYCLYAANDEIVLPEIKPTDLLDASAVSVMGFSKATCHSIQQPVGGENTVRRNQGQTHDDGTHILLKDGDENMVRNDALFAVAVSRRKKGTGLTIYADTSEVQARMVDRLRLRDTEFLSKIPELARPDYRAYYERERTIRFGPDIVEDEQTKPLAGMLLEARPWVEGKKSGEDLSWLDNLIKHLWTTAEEKARAEEREKEKPAAEEPEVWHEADPGHLAIIEKRPKKQWCTLECMVSYRRGKARSVPFSHALLASYVQHVSAKVKGEWVPINVLVEWLDSNSIKYLIRDTRDGTYRGNWDGLIMDFHPKPIYLVNYDGQHVTPMSSRTLKDISKRRVVEVASSDGTSRSAEYCDFWTIQDFELHNGISVARPVLGERMQDVVRLMAVLVKGNTAPGAAGVANGPRTQYRGAPVALRLKSTLDVAGGIGLFGRDEVYKVDYGAQLKTDLALVMADQHQYAYGGHTGIVREDVHPEVTVLEREMPGSVDAYRLGMEIDPSVGVPIRSNAVGASMGPSALIDRMELRRDPLYIRLNKRGQMLGTSDEVYAFGGGFGNTQTDAVVETLGAAQRYLVKPRGGRESVEGRRHAWKMARDLYVAHFDEDSVISEDQRDLIHQQFLRAAASRCYDLRAAGLDRKGTQERQVTFMNKVQFKWGKQEDPLAKEAKVGQGISATSSAINLRYGSFMRQADHEYATRGKEYNIFDCYMSQEQLMERVGHEVRKLPSCVGVVTSDADEFDSCQNWHSKRAETALNCLLLGDYDAFEEYMDEVRTDYPLSAPGLFSSVVKDAKPSGAPDTLGGNTRVSDLYTEYLIQGRGPVVMVKKGDDKSRLQYDQKISRDRVHKLRQYSPLTLKITAGDTQFCGMAMTSDGLYMNLVGLVRKALAHGDKGYRTWAEYQISLRDNLKLIRSAGVAETVAATASAMGMRLDLVWTYYSVYQSLCHISEQQWADSVITVSRNVPAPRDAWYVPRPWA